MILSQFRFIPDKEEELSQGHKANKWNNLSPKLSSYHDMHPLKFTEDRKSVV